MPRSRGEASGQSGIISRRPGKTVAHSFVKSTCTISGCLPHGEVLVGCATDGGCRVVGRGLLATLERMQKETALRWIVCGFVECIFMGLEGLSVCVVTFLLWCVVVVCSASARCTRT